MKLKFDEAGKPVLQDGHPVYVFPDGKESPFDAGGALQKISQLNAEAKGHRERAEKAEVVLKNFEGIDPEKAKEALEIAQKISDKKLIESGEVDKVKAGIESSYKSQIESLQKAVETERAKAQAEVGERDALIYRLMVSDKFASSSFVRDKIADTIPPEMLLATFGGQFKVQENSVVGYDTKGKPIYSRLNPGEVAEFDEALEFIINEYPNKEKILRPKGVTGGGMTSKQRAGVSTGVRHEDTSKLDTAERIRRARAGQQ
jgi:hypothetical protein